MAADKLNILCFVTDQMRADHVAAYGNSDIQTPHLDRLAREGIRFEESFVANPVCMPNRASLFTGRYPKAHGVRENGNTLAPTEEVLPDILRRAGYVTASFGKIHLAPYGMNETRATNEHELFESRKWWAEGNEPPAPYYGFEHLYLTLGHGPYCSGHYQRDLDRDHPGMHARLSRNHALSPPTGTRESWKAAIPEEFHYNTAIADRAIEFLYARERTRPFFAWCSFPDPHHPYSPPRPYCDHYDPEALRFAPARRDGEWDRLPPYFRDCYEGKIRVGGLEGGTDNITESQYREILAHTYGMISMVDHNIGRVLKVLEETGDLERTAIVFLSDHADLMGDHHLINKGPFLFRGLVRVPTIWRLPGAAKTGRASSALVSAVDFCPTVLDLAGVQAPEGVQGRSYRGLLAGDAVSHRDAVYIEYDETYIKDRLRQIRTADWALTYYANSDYGLLYDLQRDPGELQNRWDDPACRDVKANLLAALLRHTSAADDWLPPKLCHA